VPARARLLNLAAMQPTVQRVCALTARAHSMISVDTGPAHVAGAMDCPLVVLYGMGGWRRWLPRARSAQVIPLGPLDPDPAAKLLDIPADAVLAAWQSLVGRT
jgi:heptosyltransferase-2/heptosyltransferase-3